MESIKCPYCEKELEYQEYDPSVGLMNSGWYCDECECWIPEEDYDYVIERDNK